MGNKTVTPIIHVLDDKQCKVPVDALTTKFDEKAVYYAISMSRLNRMGQLERGTEPRHVRRVITLPHRIGTKTCMTIAEEKGAATTVVYDDDKTKTPGRWQRPNDLFPHHYILLRSDQVVPTSDKVPESKDIKVGGQVVLYIVYAYPNGTTAYYRCKGTSTITKIQDGPRRNLTISCVGTTITFLVDLYETEVRTIFTKVSSGQHFKVVGI